MFIPVKPYLSVRANENFKFNLVCFLDIGASILLRFWSKGPNAHNIILQYQFQCC